MPVGQRACPLVPPLLQADLAERRLGAVPAQRAFGARLPDPRRAVRCAASATLSKTSRLAKILVTWKVYAMPRATRECTGRREISAPAKRIFPAVGQTRPQIRLTKVDLPAPLGPMIARISPRATSKSTLSTALTPPKWQLSPRVESRLTAAMARLSRAPFP